MSEQVAVVGIAGSPASYPLTMPTVSSRRLRVVQGEAAAGTAGTDIARALPDDVGADQQAVIRHLPVPPARPEAMSLLPGLRTVLASPVSAVANTSAALLALPGRLLGLVSSAEQTLAAAHAAVTRTEALLDRVEPTVRRLTDTTGPQEIQALVTLIDRLPDLAETVDHDVLPLLGRLGQARPDIFQLLEGVSHVNRLLQRLPKVFGRHHNSAANN